MTDHPAEAVLHGPLVDEYLPRRPVAVRHARALAWDALGPPASDAGEDLALVVTELVANAVRHGRGRRLRLRVVERGGTVRVEVENRRWTSSPRRRLASEERTDGRGLALVAGCSRRWGVDAIARGHTLVWAELDRP